MKGEHEGTGGLHSHKAWTGHGGYYPKEDDGKLWVPMMPQMPRTTKHKGMWSGHLMAPLTQLRQMAVYVSSQTEMIGQTGHDANSPAGPYLIPMDPSWARWTWERKTAQETRTWAQTRMGIWCSESDLTEPPAISKPKPSRVQHQKCPDRPNTGTKKGQRSLYQLRWWVPCDRCGWRACNACPESRQGKHLDTCTGCFRQKSCVGWVGADRWKKACKGKEAKEPEEMVVNDGRWWEWEVVDVKFSTMKVGSPKGLNLQCAEPTWGRQPRMVEKVASLRIQSGWQGVKQKKAEWYFESSIIVHVLADTRSEQTLWTVQRSWELYFGKMTATMIVRVCSYSPDPSKGTARMGKHWNNKSSTLLPKIIMAGINWSHHCTQNQLKLEMLKEQGLHSIWKVRSQRRPKTSACRNCYPGGMVQGEESLRGP